MPNLVKRPRTSAVSGFWSRPPGALAKHKGALVARARGVRCGHSIIVRLLGVRVRLGLGLGSGSVVSGQWSG